MKYLIPPKLNEKYLLFGCTIPEILISLALFLMAAFAKNPYLLALPAIVLVSSFRFLDNARNARDYIKLIYNYYFKPQIFCMERSEETHGKGRR